MKNENSEKKERKSPNFRENFSNRPIFVYHTILLDKLYEKSQKLSMYAVFVQSVYNYFYRGVSLRHPPGRNRVKGLKNICRGRT